MKCPNGHETQCNNMGGMASLLAWPSNSPDPNIYSYGCHCSVCGVKFSTSRKQGEPTRYFDAQGKQYAPQVDEDEDDQPN